MSIERTKLYVWGSDSHGQLGLLAQQSFYKTPQPTSLEYNVKNVACGQKHILFVNDDGICFGQGCNQNGQLGIDNKEIEYSRVPLKIGLPEPVTKIFCGFSYNLALLQNKEVYGWGLNEQGILGSFNLNIFWKPVKINIDKRHRIKTISCGALHCGFVTQEGDVLMCGSNQYGELGFNKKEKVSLPTQLDISFHATDISCGVFYTLLLDKQGKVYSFGNNKYGQLGTGTKQSQCFPRKIKALENEYVVKVSAGYHSGALTNRGELFIWGSGTFGEHLLPYRIQLEPNNFYVQFSIGGFFGTAIDKYGKLYTWGNNASGQLGQGNSKSIKNPTQVQDIKGIQRVYCGHNFVVAVPKQNSFPRSVSQTPKRISFKNRYQSSPKQSRPKNFASIQKAVSNFKRTVNQLQSKQSKLTVQNQQLQIKLQQLSIDYQKLVQKYQLIQTIVSEKQRMIAIYEEQIRQSNIRLVQSSTIAQKYHILIEENAQMNIKVNEQNRQMQQYILRIESLAGSIQNYKKKFDCLSNTSQSLTQTNQSLSQITESLKKENDNLKTSIDSLKASERYLKSQIKNQKHLDLEKGVEQIIKSKDYQIEQLIKKSQNLKSQVMKINQKQIQIQNLKQLLQQYKITVCELQASLNEREDEINQIHLQQEHEKNIKKFTGFMCSPSERSDSKSRLSPLKIQCENRLNPHQLSATKQSMPSTYHYNNTNVKDLKKIIRQLENQMISLNQQLQTKVESETKLQREIQEQMLISAQLKQDIRELNGSLTLTQSQHTNSKNLLNKYESIISLKQHQSAIHKSKVEQLQHEFQLKQLDYINNISKLELQSNTLQQKISIIEDRQRQSLCIIRAQKRQIEDLKIIQSDFDTKTIQYKKMFKQIEDKNYEIQNLEQKALELSTNVKELEQIISLEREEFIMKHDRIEKELLRVNEIKDKLYENSNQLFNKNSQLEEQLHQYQLSENRISCQLAKIQQKLTLSLESLEESHNKSDNLTLENLSLKNEIQQLTHKLNELQLLHDECKIMLENTAQELKQTLSKYQEIDQLYKQLVTAAENKSEQILELETKLQKRQKEIGNLTTTVQEISQFNKQYSSNESVYINKMKELQNHVANLQGYMEDQDISVKDMSLKNKQLDRKNRQLADMLNKAIQQQATEYKQKIMCEVANNASMILENFSEDVINLNILNINGSDSCTSRRQIRQFGYEITNHNPIIKESFKSRHPSPKKSNSNLQQTPQQKYNKLLSNKIEQNKKKISQSANKLCELLDLREIDNEDKYSQINLKIESMDQQKEVLLNKLANYAEKLKHI